MQAWTISANGHALVEMKDATAADVIAKAGAFQSLFGVQPYIQVMGIAYDKAHTLAVYVDEMWHQVVSVDTKDGWKIFAAGMYQQVYPEGGVWRYVRFSSDKTAAMLNKVALQAAAP